ncbi:amidohydrolase family protein [Emcibacter sp. SYSU 3D8]|uniref:amidohydrolase family protein n=1 Tax=Emcibacter sp. SYSU 3D8 TaxID=3133969 RepID=UPI0031FE494B
MAPRAEWLELVKEEALDPDRPIVDPHHHLWERPGFRYLLDEFLADQQGHNIIATVYVQAASMHRIDGPEPLRPIGETEFVNGIAAMSASGIYGTSRMNAGIVGHANLRLGAAVADVLDAHLAVARGRFRGIRHAVASDTDPAVDRAIMIAAGWDPSKPPPARPVPPPGLLGDAAFREGIATLGRYGMSFDAWLYHPQIPELTALARARPEVSIILDHVGGVLGIGPYAGRHAEVMAKWKADMAELATCPNVSVKVGGLTMPICGFGWENNAAPPTSEDVAARTRDWYLFVIDTFGPERCMFESNFPVDKSCCSYMVLWNAFKRMTADFSEADKTALFSSTAKRVYRLDL